jgi:ATP-dependent DNA helicase PIF1
VPRDAIAKTALTGIAAINIGGVTINSFSGIGFGLGKREKVIDRVCANSRACNNWEYTQFLIIDESEWQYRTWRCH